MLQTRRDANETEPRPWLPVGIRKIAIAIAGCSVLALGLGLVVVPIPGTTLVIIPLGLTILAKEFVWARRMLGWSRRIARSVWIGVRRRWAGQPPALIAALPGRAPWDPSTPVPVRT